MRREVQGRREVVAVGLTGAMGAGKSTALAVFGELGALVFSADEVVHHLYQQPAVAARVGSQFGRAVLDEHQVVDRSRLAAAVRGRPDELHWLEKLTHPLVAKEIGRRIGEAPAGAVVVCEVPLLFESGYEALFDVIVTVEANRKIRCRRSVHGFDLEQFSELDGLQAPSVMRRAGSDFVFVNDGGLDDLRDFVRRTYCSAQALLDRDDPGRAR